MLKIFTEKFVLLHFTRSLIIRFHYKNASIRSSLLDKQAKLVQLVTLNYRLVLGFLCCFCWSTSQVVWTEECLGMMCGYMNIHIVLIGNNDCCPEIILAVSDSL